MKDLEFNIQGQKVIVSKVKQFKNHIEFEYKGKHYTFKSSTGTGPQKIISHYLDDIAHKNYHYHVDSDCIYDGSQHLKIEQIQKITNLDSQKQKSPVLKSDFPGTIIALHCKVGDKVDESTSLLTIESMKLQRSLLAPIAGIIETINIAENDVVKSGQELVIIKAQKEEAK